MSSTSAPDRVVECGRSILSLVRSTCGRRFLLVRVLHPSSKSKVGYPAGTLIIHKHVLQFDIAMHEADDLVYVLQTPDDLAEQHAGIVHADSIQPIHFVRVDDVQ